MISQAISLMNLQTVVCMRQEGSFFCLSQLFLPLFLSFDCTLTPLNIPNVDDLVLGKVVASNVGQWKVPLQKGSDPCFLMSLVLHVFAEPLFSLVVVKMSNLPEVAHFAQELCLFSIIARVELQGALCIQGISDYWRTTLKVVDLFAPVLLLLQLGQSVLRAHLAARPVTIKTQRQSTRLALRLDVEEETWWWLGFEDDFQDQRGAQKSLQIDNAVDCTGSLDPSCVKCKIECQTQSISIF